MNFQGFGCREVAVTSSAIQWPDLDLNGFIENTRMVGGAVWELITEKV